MPRWWRLGVLILAVMLLAVGALLWIRDRRAAPFPAALTANIGFAPYYPRAASGIFPDPATIKLDPATHVLTFQLTLDGATLLVSEQKYPEVLVFDKLGAAMNPIKEFSTSAGDVMLTRPSGQADGQTALLNGADVLLFARSQQDLSDGQWRRLFQGLQVAR